MRTLRQPLTLLTRLWRWPLQVFFLLIGKSGKLFWQLGLDDEIRYWKTQLASGGKAHGYEKEFNARLDPARALESKLGELLDQIEEEQPKILDVGSGPLTSLGKIHNGHALDITATDPLANIYNALIDQYKVPAPVKPIECKAEELVSLFGPESFDITQARNSIDHSIDPVASIGTMLEVTKPGGFLYMVHAVNEAKRNRYSGLHQWNTYQKGSDFYARNMKEETNISEHFSDLS